MDDDVGRGEDWIAISPTDFLSVSGVTNLIRCCHPLGDLDCFVARDEQMLQIDC